MSGSARPGVYVKDADDTVVELALDTGLPVIAVSGGVTARLVRTIEAAKREVRVVPGPPADTVTSVAAARAQLSAGPGEVFLDLRALLGRIITEASSLAGSPQYPGADWRAAAASDDRAPLVLLSGMLGDASLWNDVAARLEDVVRPWPARIDLDDSVQELAAGVLAVAPPQFALVGHSLGGIVALEVQRQAPGRVSRLALLASSARPASPPQLAAWRTWEQRVTAGEFDAIVTELGVSTLGPRARGDDRLRTVNTAMARTVGPAGFLRQLHAQASRPDSLPLLASIGSPLLVMSGESDDICPPALQQELCSAVADSDLVEVAGVGHMLPLEAPDDVAAALRTWLADGQ